MSGGKGDGTDTGGVSHNFFMTEPGFNASVVSNEYRNDFASSMMYMERPYRPPKEKFPKVAVPNTSIGVSGLSFSIEPGDLKGTQTEDGRLEFETLKCILNREAFIYRILYDIRVVNKRFKMEIADLIDCIRVATIDVCDAIVRWRECKHDHDAAFNWNGMNYLLKMSSDLDILDQYQAVRRWAGFSFVRNPLAVPFPMEHGLSIFAGRILDPEHLDNKLKVAGSKYIGGISQLTLRKKYTPKSMIKSEFDEFKEKRQKKKLKSVLAPEQKKKKSEEEKVDPLDFKIHAKDMKYVTTANEFGLNDDMSRARQAELVILKEEEKFGQFGREPEGRIAPVLQAYTRYAALELCKDDKKSLEDPSSSDVFAPHGANSDIGIVDVGWQPDKKLINSLLNSELLLKTDKKLTALNRGEAKIGGALAKIMYKGTDPRIRKPCRISLSSETEFSRTTLRKYLTDSMNVYNELNGKIEQIKYQIIGLDEANRGLSSSTIEGQAFLAPELIDDVDARIRRIKKAVVREAVTAAKTLTSEEVSETKTDGVTTLSVPTSIDETASGTISPSKAINNNSNITPKKSIVGTKKSKKVALSENINDKAISEGKLKIIKKLEELRGLEEEVAKLLQDLPPNINGKHMYYSDGLDRLRREDILTKAYKDQERILNNREKSRNIERRRRLLTEEEGERKGPPPQEPSNIYDYYAIRIQRMIRGYVGRCYAKWLRAVSVNATTVMQKIVRGWLARLFCKRKIMEYKAVTNIIKVYRGWKARGTSAAMVKQKGYITSTLKIQCVWRGYLGKCRAHLKRSLDKAAANAITIVDPQAIEPNDVRDLGRRILNAIEEPGVTEFPPIQTLILLRICSIIINTVRGPMGISSYDFINDRTFKDIKSENMDWFAAAQLLNRADRFMRVIRALAFGPAAKPPRILLIPAQCINMFVEQTGDPNWKLSVFENMGKGARFATQLFKWVNAIVEVAEKQQVFMGFLASNFPPWLPDMARIQAKQRQIDLELEVNRRCISIMEAQMNQIEDPTVQALISKDLSNLIAETHEFKLSYAKLQRDCDKIRKDQSSREKFAKITYEGKIKIEKKEYEDCLQEFNEVEKLAEAGDAAAAARFKDVKNRYIKAKLTYNEMEAQFKLLIFQCEKNEERRRDPGRLPIEIAEKAYRVGDLKFANLLNVAVTKSILMNAGVKKEKELRANVLVLFKKSEAADVSTKFEFRKLYYEVENKKIEHDNEVMDSIRQMESNDMKGKDQMIPSDKDLQEERMEDETQSTKEREKKLQFIADRLLQPFVRKQPWFVCLSRDLPGAAKKRIVEDLMKNMPDVFRVLNVEKNMGFDVKAIQGCLDEGKSVILLVDAGLTKMTRANFIYNLEMCCKCVVPISPLVCIAMGDEKNKRTASYSAHYGVTKPDLQCLNDGNIKSCLESLSWVMDELEKKSKYYIALQSSAMNLIPPSPSFAIVIEALYIMQTEEDTFFVAPGPQNPDTWRMTHIILADPNKLFAKIRSMKRGCGDFAMLELLGQYMNHKCWPKYGSAERGAAPTLHLLAYLVETWVLCENLTKLGGGVPPSFNIDACYKYLRTVVYVSDTCDAEDLINPTKDIISLYGWRSASARIQRAILADMQVSKITRKFNNVLHTLTVYRENSMIYFDAYNPVTTEMYWTSICANEVASIICPNFTKRFLGGENGEVGPQDLNELHRRLILNLNLEKFSSHNLAKLMMKCKRQDSFLRSVKTIIDGHFVFLTMYEAALGELYFTVSIPEFTGLATVLLPLHKRLPLVHQAMSDKEKAIFHDDDARPMLDFIVDRLMIYPSRALVRCTGIADIMKGEFRDRHMPPTLQVSQGFKLKIRYHGGYGKLIYRRVLRFNDVQHILSIMRCSKDNSLRVIVYDPIEQYHMETVVTDYLRKCLLGSTMSAPRVWIDEFMSRFKYNWRGKKHSISFDQIVLTRGYNIAIVDLTKNGSAVASAFSQSLNKKDDKSVSTLSKASKVSAKPTSSAKGKKPLTKGPSKGPDKLKTAEVKKEERPVKRRYIAHLKIIDEHFTEFSMYDPVISKTFTMVLSREDMCRLQQKFRIDRGEIQMPAQAVKDKLKFPAKSRVSRTRQRTLPDPDLYPNNASSQLNLNFEVVGTSIDGNIQPTANPDVDAIADRDDSSITGKNESGDVDEGEGEDGKVNEEDEEYEENAEEKEEKETGKEREAKGDDDGSTVASKISMSSEELNFYNYDITFYELLKDFPARELFLSHLVKSVEVTRNEDSTFTLKLMGSDVKELKENEEYSSPIKKSENPFDTSLKLKSTLKFWPKTDDIDEVISHHRQLKCVRLSDYYDQLQEESEAKAVIASDKDRDSALALQTVITESIGPGLLYGDTESFNAVVEETTKCVVTEMLDHIFNHTLYRFEERNEPGTRQALFLLEEETKRRLLKEVYVPEIDWRFEHGIVGREEKLVFEETNIRTTYREGAARYLGQVNIKVYDQFCWLGASGDGCGRKLRFVVFEPGCGKEFIGFINNSVHLKDTLGFYGQDLLPKSHTAEMLIYITKFRMEVCKNQNRERDDDPLYYVNFQNDSIFDGKSADEKAEEGDKDPAKVKERTKKRLKDLEKSRGRKVLRMSRRVSGVLMYITVFELPIQKEEPEKPKEVPPEEADTKATNDQGKSGDDLDVNSDNQGINEEKKEEGKPATSKIPPEEAEQEVTDLGYTPPSFRIICYDARTKRKTVTLASPEAITEAAGGKNSPFLADNKREALATLVCNCLQIYYFKDREPEVCIPWFGSIYTIEKSIEDKDKILLSWKPKFVKTRPGKIYSERLLMGKLEVIMSFYNNRTPKIMEDGSEGWELGVIANVYCGACPVAPDLPITENEQTARLGKPLLHFPEGNIRHTTCRRLAKFVQGEVVISPEDNKTKLLKLWLMGAKFGFLTEYGLVRPFRPGEYMERPVGYPTVFMPLDTCGVCIARRGMTLDNRNSGTHGKVDCIVTVYTKQKTTGPERGLVIKCYERSSSYTGTLHISPSELMWQLERNGVPKLLKEIVAAKDDADSEILDSFEENFEALTAKGEKINKYRLIVNKLVEIVLNDIGVWDTPELKFIPYFKSKPTGHTPQ